MAAADLVVPAAEAPVVAEAVVAVALRKLRLNRIALILFI